MADVAQAEGRDLVLGMGCWRQVTRRGDATEGQSGPVLDTEPLPPAESERLDKMLVECSERAWELVEAVLVMRATGQPPWAFGKQVSRTRLYAAAAMLAPAFAIAPQLWQVAAIKQGGGGCPLLASR
jgi:hypothetical protein